MPAFADHFSVRAEAYASFRPHYPAALFAWLAARSPDRTRAWDCGTGNGQAAQGLAAHFAHVIASDPSVAQLSHATRAANIHYVAMTAERTALDDRSVELVTVAQALHWFDRAAFYDEVRRVLRPGGALAVWSYPLLRVDPAVDAIMTRFHDDTVGSCWPSERRIVDSGYAGIDLPFDEEVVPPFEMVVDWTLSQLLGYVSTWSAVSRYRAARGEDPLPGLHRALAAVWGPGDRPHRVRWPLLVRVARAPR